MEEPGFEQGRARGSRLTPDEALRALRRENASLD
jgi:hypothetical protein